MPIQLRVVSSECLDSSMKSSNLGHEGIVCVKVAYCLKKHYGYLVYNPCVITNLRAWTARYSLFNY